MRIHHPLFAGFIAVIGLMVVMTLVLVSGRLRNDLETTFQGEIERQLGLGAAIIAATGPADPDSLARLITDRIQYRVTLIDTAGVVLGDSYVEAASVSGVENHADRPEVRGVLQGGELVSFSQRTSETVGDPLLYGARLVSLNGERLVLRIAAPETEIERAIDRVQQTVAIAGFFAMLIAMVAAYLLSMAFARPLVTLGDRALRLSEGDFDGRVPHGRVAELQDVAIAFNRLGEQLRTRLSELGNERDEMQTLIDCMAEGVIALTEDARLVRTNRTARELLALPDLPALSPIGSVVRDPALRQALEQSVVQPAHSCELKIGGRDLLLSSRTLDRGGAVTTLLDITELRRLEQVRRDFVANASHELKTPLTSIRGYAETLVETDPPEDLRRQFLESIRINTLRLQRLVDDLLDLSRIESGGWSTQSERFTVREAVVEAWDIVRSGVEDRKVAFELTGGEALVLADRQALIQVLRNLLENAVRHTEEGGHVRVAASSKVSGSVVVDVTDDGEGIPTRALPRIFERFYRADSSRARDFGGTGLGLAIVKHLVGAMGGEIEAKSELGEGTTITFTLRAG